MDERRVTDRKRSIEKITAPHFLIPDASILFPYNISTFTQNLVTSRVFTPFHALLFQCSRAKVEILRLQLPLYTTVHAPENDADTTSARRSKSVQLDHPTPAIYAIGLDPLSWHSTFNLPLHGSSLLVPFTMRWSCFRRFKYLLFTVI
jgi:hypothetical protein